VPDVGPGGCVALCGDGPSGGNTYTPQRTYVDPAIERARREAQETIQREQARRREIQRKAKVPYQGVNIRRESIRAKLDGSLWKLGDNSASVDSVTYEEVPGVGGEIFVPGSDLGNIALARPVNPTLRETQIAAEQLAKAGAVLHFAASGGGSSEDQAFLSSQAAQVMVGGRSYVHVTVDTSQPPRVQSGNIAGNTADIGSLLDDIMKAQADIRRSEIKRSQIMQDAKKDIAELAALQQDIQAAIPGDKRESLRAKARKLAERMEQHEADYMSRLSDEKEKETEISGKAKKLQREIIWKD
jgi:hypothetical protein